MLVGHYRIIEKIGAGGMGEVYLAEDTELNRKVALKFLSPHLCQDADCQTRFKREAQAAAKLNHPNIVTIHEVNEFNGRPFFAMEYVEGQSLRELIKGKELPIERVMELAIQICEGLHKAHQSGIVHRDVKPANILIDADGRAKILDFGLATVQGCDHLTKTGSTLGTIGYMSPEQVRGEQIDHRTDIFSLGVVLYELITGRLPFKGENDAATMHNIAYTEPEPLARYKTSVSEDLQRIVGKALTKKKDERYQHVDDLLADLKHLRSAFDTASVLEVIPVRKKRRIWLPVSALVIIAMLALILKPWKVEITPTQEATAAENRLAIMYFDNLADPEDKGRWGEIVTNLLITGLSESQYMQVVSSQRLYDILKLLGKEGTRRIDRDVASKVAEKAKAKWMLLGSVIQTEPEIVLTAQLVDIATGTSVASQRVAGTAGEKIFTVVDRLSAEIKNDLALPAAAKSELRPSIADVTTHSPEAYRYYLEGIDYSLKMYEEEAAACFRKAVQLDSTFVMANFLLADYLDSQNKPREEIQPFLSRAQKYASKSSQKERWYVAALTAKVARNWPQCEEELLKIVKRYPDEKMAYNRLASIASVLRQSDKEIEYLTRLIEIDPLYKDAYNSLAYTYMQMGDIDKAIWAIDKYISLAPDEPNPYDSRGDLYAAGGKLGEARASYLKALQIKPDFYATLPKLGNMYVFQGDYVRADSCYRTLVSCGNREYRSGGRIMLAWLKIYQGRMKEALELLDAGIAADKMEGTKGRVNIFKYVMKAYVHAEGRQNPTAAVQEIETAMRLAVKDLSRIPKDLYLSAIEVFATVGDYTQAEALLNVFKKELEAEYHDPTGLYWQGAGFIELAKGNLRQAVADLENSMRPPALPSFWKRYLLGKAYLESGMVGEAVAQLEKALAGYGTGRNGAPAITVYYLLGQAYEKSGWTKKAIEQYETFLNIWKDADPGITEVDDAKARLARLRNQS
jgi:serine/threonine protein kinase/tetratricopeptide (TPR) repeat protein